MSDADDRLKVLRLAIEKLESTAGRDYTAPTLKRFAKIWMTADGRPLKIQDMDDRHLQNAIRMLESFFWTHFTQYPDLIEEAMRRPPKLNAGPSQNEANRLDQERAFKVLYTRTPYIKRIRSGDR